MTRRTLSREEIRAALTGPIWSICTPFFPDGAIDFDGVRRQIDAMIAAGARTMVLTAGDSQLIILSDQEIAELTKVTVNHTAGRALVVAAGRYFGTGQSVAFAKFAADIGADVFMVLPPDWAASATPETLVDHYRATAEHIPVMVVTNVFIPRGIDFGLRTLRLCLEQVPGIVAVKDDFCGIFGRKMALLVHDQWAVFVGGQKQHHLDLHLYGCDGYMSLFLAFRPDLTRRYWQAIQAGDLCAARQVVSDYDIPFFDLLSASPGGFDAAQHGLLELSGLAPRWRRQPYYSLTDADMEQLKAKLQDLKLLTS